MSETLPTPSEVRRQLADLASPLREQLATIEKGIEVRQEELEGLRELRTEIRRALATVDPQYAEEQRLARQAAHKNGSTKRSPRAASANGKPVSEELVARTEAFLRAHRNEYPDGFSASQLAREHRSEVAAQSTLNWAFRALHDQGTLRLDRRGIGGAKVYKLTS